MRLALYQPDIPQNAGNLVRTAVCLGIAVDLIEPAGFVLTDAKMRRAGMDYLERAGMTLHVSWPAFLEARRGARLVLLSRHGADAYTAFPFAAADVLLVGRESTGAPAAVHDAVAARVRIPMAPGARSLNVAAAAAMVLGEALRQTGGFPAAPG